MRGRSLARRPEALRFTYGDLRALPDDDKRYEILDAKLVVSPSPSPLHQIVARNLHRLLDRHVVENRLGEILFAPVDVVLARTAVVVPDLLFVRADRTWIIGPKAIKGAPDLVVEILSPGSRSRDRGKKKTLYARRRVTHYWIVDPDEGRLELFELVGAKYRRAAVHEGNDVVRPSLFPGLRIPLAEVWATVAAPRR